MTRLLVGAGLVVIALCLIVLARPTPAEPLRPPPPVVAPPPPPPATPAPAPAEAPGAEPAVAAQLALIDAGRLDAFRATFTPDVRVTAADLDACRVRVHQVPVRPDWEMAKDSVEDGRRVRRVSMFGKSMTGFHEQRDGRWLADALWCVPVGLP